MIGYTFFPFSTRADPFRLLGSSLSGQNNKDQAVLFQVMHEREYAAHVWNTGMPIGTEAMP